MNIKVLLIAVFIVALCSFFFALIVFRKVYKLDLEKTSIAAKAEPLWEKSVKICFRVEDERTDEELKANHPNLMREALYFVDQAIELRAQNPRFHYTRGWILDELDNFEGAIAAYERAKQLGHPDIGRIIYNIACSYSKSNKLDKALEELTKIKDVDDIMEFARVDSDLDNLKNDPELRSAVNQLLGING